MKQPRIVRTYSLLFFTLFSFILLGHAQSSNGSVSTTDTTVPSEKTTVIANNATLSINLDLSGEMEWKTKTKENGGAAVHGVYNPAKQKVEWKTETKDKGGAAVHGVYNPVKRKVEWKTKTKDLGAAAVHGVYNPESQDVEWKTATKERGGAAVYGVYNPESQEVEWKTETRQNGDVAIYGVYNPASQEVEWKTEIKRQGENEGIGGLVIFPKGKEPIELYGLGASVHGVWKPDDLDSYATFLSLDEYYTSVDNTQMYNF